jgi:hypothetical protein
VWRRRSPKLGKSGKLWPVADPAVQRARDAERKLAEIARTRRPTPAETTAATTAYAAAAKVAAKKEKVCRYCGQKLHWEGDHFECGGEGEGACSFWSAIGDYDRAGRPKDVEGWLDGWIQRAVGIDWKDMGWDRSKHAAAIRNYFKLGA